MFKDDVYYGFCKMFVVFYAVNICVFMTCSTSCCLFDTLMVPWNVYTYVRMYARTIKKNTVAFLVTSNEAFANITSENVAKLKYSHTQL